MTRARNSANLASHGNLFVDITNDRTGIGSVVPAQNLHVAGTAGFHADVTFTGDLYNTTWDRSDNSLKFVDGAKAKFGTSENLQLYFDGSSYITNGTAGHLFIKTLNGGSDIRLSSADDFFVTTGGSDSNWTIVGYSNAQVELYHNVSKKFETTAYGTNTTGTAVNDGLVVAGVATVTTMNVTGVLTYDDVTSVDSIGIITARAGINVTGGNINVSSGTVTATSFSGSGANLTDIITGIATDASGNTFGGHLAGNALTSGNEDNVLIGREAGKALNASNGDDNVFIGAHAGAAATSLYQSVLIGYKAGSTGQTGERNVIIGDGNFNYNNQDQLNSCTFVGYGAGSNQQDSYNEYNTFIGYGAGQSSGSDYNVCVGRDAGNRRSDRYGIFIGDQVGNVYGTYGDMTGQNNIMIGRQTGHASTSGADNTLMGHQCGMTLTTGSNNLVLGHDADVSGATVSNEITLGDANITKFRIPGLNYVNDAGKVLINRNAEILASSSSKLEVYNATENHIFVANSTAATSQDAGIIFAPANNVYGGKIIVTSEEDFSTSANRSAHMAFYTRKDGTAAEGLRIASNGKVLVNCTSVGAGGADPQLGVEAASGSNIGIIQVHAGGGESDGDLSGIAFSHGNDNQLARPKIAIASRATGSYGRGDLCFYIDNASDNNAVSSGDEKVRITSAGRVGIGTNDPTTYKLHVQESTSAIARFERTGGAFAKVDIKAGTTAGNSYLTFSDSAASEVGEINYEHADDSLRIAVNSAERLRIDSSGRVLIGTTTEGHPAGDNLTVADSGHAGITIRSGTTSNGALYFSDGTSGSNEYKGGVVYHHDGNYLRFYTNGTERLRIDSSGRVLIGTTSGTDALIVDGGSDAGTIQTNSTNSNGNMMTFKCSGTSKFFIGSAGSFITGNTGTANQGIRAEGHLLFATGGHTERARITSSGVALFNGLTSQSTGDTAKFAVQGGDSNIGIIKVHAGGGETNGDLSGISFSHGNDNQTARAKGAIALECDASGNGRGDLCFYVDGAADNNEVSSGDEKVRITKQGNLIFKDKDSGHIGGGFYSRTKTCSGNTTTSFMRFVLTHGALAGAIYATASNNARSIAKSYTYAVQYGDGNGVNLQSDSGDMGGTNFSVVCNTSANQHDFRVTVTGSHSIEVNLTVVVGCANQDITYTEL